MFPATYTITAAREGRLLVGQQLAAFRTRSPRWT